MLNNTHTSPHPHLNTLISHYLRDWVDVQQEISKSEHAGFFGRWSPDLLTRDTALSIPELWILMDKAWDEDPPQTHETLLNYYSHPVWWLNSKIEETDAISIQHRLLAVMLAEDYKARKALDRGGGYGLLVKMAHHLLPKTEIHLEDVINAEALAQQLAHLPRVHVVTHVQPPYDVIWSTEVFEHLEAPLQEVYDLNQLLRVGGALITSYSFYPMIKCHLPQNYYLRHVFHRLIPLMGFKLSRFERPSVTVWVFEKTATCSLARLRLIKILMTVLYIPLLLLNKLYPILRRPK